MSPRQFSIDHTLVCVSNFCECAYLCEVCILEMVCLSEWRLARGESVDWRGCLCVIVRRW